MSRRAGIRPSRVLVALAITLCGLTASVQGAAQNLTIHLSTSPPAAGVVSTRSDDDLTLLVRSGDTVRLAREGGRDERVAGAGVFPWIPVQTLPRDRDSVLLAPTLQEDGSVLVAVDVAMRRGDAYRRFSSTALALPGEWVRLLGSGPQPTRGVRRYGTRQPAGDALYLRVDP